MDRRPGRAAYDAVFVEQGPEYELGTILLSAPNVRNPYTDRVIKSVSRLLIS